MNKTKGIILAAGRASRLFPITYAVNKQLLAIYDKPMVYYPLSTLMLAGIKDILVISTPRDIGRYEELLKDGNRWGLEISYAVQTEPRGLADAFIVAEQFIANDLPVLILGDNIFYGSRITQELRIGQESNKGATVFVYQVKKPERYGIKNYRRSLR